MNAGAVSTTATWRRLAVAAALALVLGGAAAARFAGLDANPGGLWPDEAAEALAGREILQDPTYRPVFLASNGGREALYAYTLAAGFAVAGDSVLTLRAVAAAWGVLGVLGVWILARRFGTGAGLSAAAWAAGSLALIAISRVGMRNTIAPVFCAIALAALLAWRDRPTRTMAVVAGAVLAVSTLYTYQALRLLPVLALMWVLWLRRIDRDAYRRMMSTAPVFLASFAIVGAPVIAFAIGDPQAYLGRVAGVSPFNPDLAPHVDFGAHVITTLGMFVFAGDPNARHNVAGLPLLGWPLALLALVGLAALWRGRADARHALILLSLPVLMIPPLLAIEGSAPHYLRALGAFVPLAITIGLGTQTVARWLTGLIRRGDRSGRLSSRAATLIPTAALAGLFATLGFASASTYLTRPVADRYVPFRFDLTAMVELAQPTDALVVNEFDALTVRFMDDRSVRVLVLPGEPIPTDGFDRFLAVSQGELRAVLGEEVAAGAVAVAWDPRGRPTVWAIEIR